MSLKILGNIVNNLGAASDALALQFPLYPEKIREQLGEAVHLGTINIRLLEPLIVPVESYDLDTGGERGQRIQWTDDWVAERFLFKKCTLSINGMEKPAWVYRSSSTPNSIDPYLVEIVTVFISDLKTGDMVGLVFEKGQYIKAVTV